MTTPVFVIHGVGNRCKTEFETTVATFGQALGVVNAHPVYWGDLGADYTLVGDSVPAVGGRAAEVRGEVERDLLGGDAESEFEVRGGQDVPQTVIDAVQETLSASPGVVAETRDGTDGDISAAVQSALAEHWPDMTSLRQIGDTELLRAVGEAVAGPLVDPSEAGPGEEVRAISIDIGGFVRKRLEELDRVVGAAVGAAVGRLNSQLRTKLLPGITRAVGDILVYQSHRDKIQQRVRDEIARVDPSLGRSQDRPVDVLAHSLGGVIAVDMATAEKEPLWIRRLATFGSQSPFFHVCDPRGGALMPYMGSAVQMPASVGQWTNLWEPLDPLAFIAKPIFRLHNGSSPTDTEVPHLASSGLLTHSDYWSHPDVLNQLSALLRSDQT